MKKSILVLSAGLAIAALTMFAACTQSRTHRLTDFQYQPKPADAPIDIFVHKVNRPYESIAIVDSKTYAQKDEAARRKMVEDVTRESRALGADAVQDVKVLTVRSHGMKADKEVPVPGAFVQGDYSKYFLRGEAVKYVAADTAAPATTPTLQATPTPTPQPTATPAAK